MSTDRLDKLEDDIDYCRRAKDHLGENIADMQRDIAQILAEQAKMKGFLGGVSFVFTCIGIFASQIFDWFKFN